MEQRKKTGLFTSWQGYGNKLRKHNTLITDPLTQWNSTAILKDGLQHINRPNLYLSTVEILCQELSWWFWHYYFLLPEFLQNLHLIPIALYEEK